MTDPEKPVEVPRGDAGRHDHISLEFWKTTAKLTRQGLISVSSPGLFQSHSTLNQKPQKCLKRRRNPLIWGSLDPPRGSGLSNVTEQLRKKTPLRFVSLKI